MRIPCYADIGYGAKSAEGLDENFVIDFGGEIVDEDVVTLGVVFLVPNISVSQQSLIKAED